MVVCDRAAGLPSMRVVVGAAMIGRSRQFNLMLAQLRRFAACAAPVLLEGETGTGKELAAREIHYAGARRDKPFVPVNCGAIPDSLAESELFGHRRGAFTDAKEAQAGMIEHARGGTLFLDEVDSLSPKAQVTLLRFLQDSEYRQVGGGPVRAADVRVIAATNASLQSLAGVNRFRHDLYYRLNPLYVRLPPLREREGDAALLAEHFLEVATKRLNVGARHWTPEALRALSAYAWPGNVRELENVILRTCLCSDGPEVGVRDLEAAEPDVFASPRDQAAPYATAYADSDGARDAAEADRLVCALEPSGAYASIDTPSHRYRVEEPRAHYHVDASVDATGVVTADSFSAAKASAIESFERGYLTELMRRAAGNVSEAARLSCVERRQLGKMLKKRGIEKGRFRGGE
jgi:DNA-binding NtrC family response regulator